MSLAASIPMVAIIFLATVFRSTFGFGESLIAVPLLALLMPMNRAVPLSVLVSVSIAAFVVIQDRHKIELRSAGWLILFALAGIPAGLWLLLHLDERTVKTVLGVAILAFSLYLLTGRRLKAMEKDNPAWLLACGLLSGIMGGAYGLNGPPLVIYGEKRRWSAQHFRATLQAYFLIASLAGLIGYWYTGLLQPAVFTDYLYCLPPMVPAILLGRYLNHRLQGDRFFKYVYVLLAGIALLLMFHVS